MRKTKPKAKRFKIMDWAGNDKSDYYGTFKTIDDALTALHNEFSDLPDNQFEEQIGEFYVTQADSRDSNYLEPNDIRISKKVK